MQTILASSIISTTQLAVIRIATATLASRKMKRLENTLTDAVADASLMRRLSFSSEARGVNALLSKSSIVSTGHRLEQVARRRALAKKRSTITARYGCHLKATLKAM
jgi:hypothetical protein